MADIYSELISNDLSGQIEFAARM